MSRHWPQHTSIKTTKDIRGQRHAACRHSLTSGVFSQTGKLFSVSSYSAPLLCHTSYNNIQQFQFCFRLNIPPCDAIDGLKKKKKINSDFNTRKKTKLFSLPEAQILFHLVITESECKKKESVRAPERGRSEYAEDYF